MPDKDGHATDDELLSAALPMPEEDEDEAVELSTVDDELEPIDAGDLSTAGLDPAEMSSSKIKAFGVRKPHEDHWNRTPNVTGAGAIHVKTFVTKLRLDAIDHMDTQVNEWLDAHPEYEVKFVTTTVGTLFGKNKEAALFMNIWV
ncbi:MAG: hypothetical protein ACPGYV_05380 [Phycisphaeraceae bacterium]